MLMVAFCGMAVGMAVGILVDSPISASLLLNSVVLMVALGTGNIVSPQTANWF